MVNRAKRIVLVLALASTGGAGCDLDGWNGGWNGGGGGGGGGGALPANSMEINGQVISITKAFELHQGVWPARLEFWGPRSQGVAFDFSRGPHVADANLPQGTWTAIGAETNGKILAAAEVFDPMHTNLRGYDAAATGTGTLTLGGTPPSSLAVDGTFTFTSGMGDTIRIRYSGPYQSARTTSDLTPPGLLNHMVIDGTTMPIASAWVLELGTDRYVELDSVWGQGVQFRLASTGQPGDPASELPQGEWTTLSPAGATQGLLGVSFFDAAVFDERRYTSYDAASTSSGFVKLSGDSARDTLTLDASYTFTSGAGDSVRVHYSGPYTMVFW